MSDLVSVLLALGGGVVVAFVAGQLFDRPRVSNLSWYLLTMLTGIVTVVLLGLWLRS